MQDSEKGGTAHVDNYHLYKIHANCVRTNQGGAGGMPPENFEKLHPLRLNLGAFLMIYDPLSTLYYIAYYIAIY